MEKNQTKYLPGDVAVWALILAELAVFGIFFIAFVVVGRNNPEMFTAGKLTLHKTAGLVDTLSLITASFFVASGIQYLRAEQNRKAAYMYLLGILFGFVYLVIKFNEFSWLRSAGYDLDTNTFYTLYFFITGFHWLHVMVGVVILLIMVKTALTSDRKPINIRAAESGASYWHMVDLVWILLFPLVYVLP